MGIPPTGMPVRRRGQKQNTSTEVKVTMEIAKDRIHVERRMRQAREYHQFNRLTPIHCLDLESDEVFLQFFLCNFGANQVGKDFFDD